MKKIIAAVVALISLGAYDVQAQENFQPGDNFVNVGVGVLHRVSYSAYNSTPSILVAFDNAFKKIGPGVLGIGGEVQFKGYSYKQPFSSRVSRTSNFTFAARGTYHPDIFEINKLDWYGGAAVGLRVESHKNQYNSKNGLYDVATNNVYPIIYPFVGGRYFFGSRLSVYSELGLGYLSVVKAGISFKF